jgi:hypothetical protein
VNTVKHADQVLQGMGGWDQLEVAQKGSLIGGEAAPPIEAGRARLRAKNPAAARPGRGLQA